MIKRLRTATMGGAVFSLVLALSVHASADPSAAEAGKPRAEEKKPLPPAEQPGSEAKDAGMKTRAAAKAGQLADGKDTAPPAAEAHGDAARAERSEDATDGDERPRMRRMNAAQQSYQRARERFLERLEGKDPADLSANEKKRLEMAQKALEKARARLQAAHEKKPSERMNKEARKTFLERLEKLNKERKKNREERANEQRAQLKEEFKEADPSPAITAELKHHAWRVARLHRLKELAAASERPEISNRVDELLQKENARHEEHLARLKEGGGSDKEEGKTESKSSKKATPPPAAAIAAEKKEGAK